MMKKPLLRYSLALAVVMMSCSGSNDTGLIMEAEQADMIRNARIEYHPLDPGDAFVNCRYEKHTSIDWSFSLSSPGEGRLSIRYSNGTGLPATMLLYINKSEPLEVGFLPTEDWETWNTVKIPISAQQGNNIIRIATEGSSPILLDRLIIEGIKHESVRFPVNRIEWEETEAQKDIDWSAEMVRSVMEIRTPESFGAWYYGHALMLEGMYRTYRRTGNMEILEFIKSWCDNQINPDGSLKREIHSLDNIYPGVILLRMYQESREEKYRIAAKEVRKCIHDYPRTTDGAMWHNHEAAGQLWLDGVYMSMTFLARYAVIFGEEELLDDAVRHFRIYYTHLHDPETGLMFHAYDEDGSEEWAGNPGRHSSQFWGRSIGWFVMALTEVLEVMPEEHQGSSELESMLSSLLNALVKYQDPESGMWYQVTNKPGESGNWEESSCTAMYLYAMKGAIDMDLAGEHMLESIIKGVDGLNKKISFDHNGHVRLRDICIGTNIGNYEYYCNRLTAINDNHGRGAFLIMNELVNYNNMATTSMN